MTSLAGEVTNWPNSMNSLPADLFHFLAGYLRLEEILTLDSAITQRSLRSVFHQSLNFLPLFRGIRFHSGGLQWLYNRNISIRYLHTNQFDEMSIQYLSCPVIRSAVEEINLDHNDLMTKGDFIQIGFSPSLKHLSLSGCHQITDEDLAIVLKMNPQLEKLQIPELSALTKGTIRMITESCPNLSLLNLSSNSWVDDEVIEILTTGCPLLKIILLSYTRVSDISAQNLLKTYPNLQSFEFVHCPFATETSLKILRETAIKSLQHPNQETQLAGACCLSVMLSESK
jgi:hypothetical protein